MSYLNIIRSVFIGAALTVLFGCSATQVALSKKNLDVQTRTSTAIFVEPVSPQKRKVYLEVRSGVMEFDRNAFHRFVAEELAGNINGYKLVSDPAEAQFIMQAYVLNLEKTSPTAAEAALRQGYMGGAVAAGAAVGYATKGGGVGIAGGAVAGGALELVSGALVKDVTYMLVCDVQISEKASNGALVRKDTQIDNKVSDSGTSRQTVSEVSNKKEYRTRIVTTANKVNLKLPDAQDLMFKKTAYAMAGFF